MYVADPSDFNFTQTTATSGYSAIALRTGATTAAGAKLYEISFNENEASYKWAQSRNGCAVKYEHTIEAQLPQLSQGLTTWLMSIDAAGCCCGLLLFMIFNDGSIKVIGEKYVNGAMIPKFNVKMTGASGDSGKKFDDFNGANVVFKADYSRASFDFIAGISALQAFM